MRPTLPGGAGEDGLFPQRAGHPPHARHHPRLHPWQPPRRPQRPPCQIAAQAVEHLTARPRSHRSPCLPHCYAWRRLAAGASSPPVFILP